MIGIALALGLPVLALHVMAVGLSWALRTYSRSRLEEICEARGMPARAELINQNDERTERAAEALATLTGLLLAALLGVLVGLRVPSWAVEAVIGIALVIAAIGQIGAGITGRVFAEEVLALVWPFTAALRWSMVPLTSVIRGIESIANQHTSRSPAGPRPASVEVEFEPERDESHQDREPELSEATREMMERAIELSRRDVHELMTPRALLHALPITSTAAEAATAFARSGFSRIPLYADSHDDIVGVLYAKDLYACMLSSASDPSPVINLRKLIRPPLYVPESKNAIELLTEFQTLHIQIAIVLDEHGGVAGLITLEDLLEELVGEIVDEHDKPSPEEPFKRLDESLYEVDATLPIEDLNERLHLRLPTDEDFSTVGGLAFSTLGHLPVPGATFRRLGVEFTVLRVEGRSIRRMRVDLDPSQSIETPSA